MGDISRFPYEATSPMLLSIETEVAPLTSHCNVVDCPTVILLVLAVKLLITGGPVGVVVAGDGVEGGGLAVGTWLLDLLLDDLIKKSPLVTMPIPPANIKIITMTIRNEIPADEPFLGGPAPR